MESQGLLVTTCFTTACYVSPRFTKLLRLVLLTITKMNLDVPFRTVARGSRPGSPGVRSRKVRESSRKYEEVGGG